jgi:ubiquitin-protein ligase
LLSLEKVTYLCLHPINEKIKNNYCSYINLEASEETVKKEEPKEKEKTTKENEKLKLTTFSFSSLSKGSTTQKQEIKKEDKKEIESDKNQKSIIPESDLSDEYQNEFTKLFNSFEYQKDQKFPPMTFKKVMSSKGLTSDKLRTAIMNNVVNQGPFLIVLYPSKLEKYYKTHTFFYYNGTFPSLNLTQNFDESDENLTIPYNPQNMIAQISEKNYITASFKSELDNSKDCEFCSVTVEEGSIILNIMEIINLYLTEPKSSNVNPYDNINICQKKGMEDLYYINSISDYEIFIGKKLEIGEEKQNLVFNEYLNNKIIPMKYIDEIGSLNINYIKQNKYYNSTNPFCLTRDNPVFEVPSNIKMKQLKEMFYSNLIPFKNLNSGEIVDDDTQIDKIEKYKNSNIVDLYYDIQSLKDFRSKIINGNIQSNIDFSSKISFSVNEYEPNLPVLLQFESLGGISKIITVIKATINTFKNEKVKEFWAKWIDNVDKYSQLPSFFSSLIRHKKCFNILFNLLCKMYDDNTSTKDFGIDAFKYILEILDNSFAENKSNELRIVAIKNGIFGNILEKLEGLTHEKSRKFEPTKDEEKEEDKTNEKKKDDNNTNKKTRGVGYGSDKTGDNKSWDVNSYLEGKKSNSSQIVYIIKLLINFFNCQNFIMNENLMKTFLESPILPCLESAFRGGTLLELSKDSELYMTYLEFTVILSKNHSLIPLLLEISKDYKPIQTQSVYELLSMLNDGAKLFMNCLRQSAKKEKSNEEKLATEIISTFDIVSKNIKQYQSGGLHGKNYSEILKLPLEKSYPLLLRELTFDYMSMKNLNGAYVHYYSSNSSGEPTPAKAIRLAQEFADLPRALPCESTNSIYVRIDKDNMDFMKVLIIGSEGTPYSNGAFQFDVFFDSQYPNAPPKVTLMTTGGGTTRFNPNLYANGKVCLSLLGTWRGQSTENWDPKISTLLQVLISIQSIIMSDLVYYNEPSCESEMGTPSGEAKNEAYSNIVRYANIKFAMIEQIRKPSKGFEEVIKRHFYLKKEQILKEVNGWIERSKTAVAKYTSFSYDHNSTWANKFNKPGEYTKMLQ